MSRFDVFERNYRLVRLRLYSPAAGGFRTDSLQKKMSPFFMQQII